MSAAPDWKKVRRILVVCSGNICRSPMGAGILRAGLDEAGLPDIEVQSAGTHGGHIPNASPESIDVCLENGIDIAAHVSRPLTPELMEWADLVLYMDRHHEDFIPRVFPDTADKTWPITAWRDDRLQASEVPDPYGMPISFYRRTFELLDTSIKPIVEALVAAGPVWDEEEVEDHHGS